MPPAGGNTILNWADSKTHLAMLCYSSTRTGQNQNKRWQLEFGDALFYFLAPNRDSIPSNKALWALHPFWCSSIPLAGVVE